MILRTRKVSIRTLIKLASDLKSDTGENPEYDRALAELIVDAAGLSMEYRAEVARAIGIRRRVQ